MKNVNIQGGAKVDKKNGSLKNQSLICLNDMIFWLFILISSTLGGGFDNEKAWKPQNKQNRIFLTVFNILQEKESLVGKEESGPGPGPGWFGGVYNDEI